MIRPLYNTDLTTWTEESTRRRCLLIAPVTNRYSVLYIPAAPSIIQTGMEEQDHNQAVQVAWERVRGGDTSVDALAELHTAVFVIITTRSRTLTKDPTEADALLSDSSFYYFEPVDDISFARLAEAARRANDKTHLINMIAQKTRRLQVDRVRRRELDKEFTEADEYNSPTQSTPEEPIPPQEIIDLLDDTGLAAGPLLCLRLLFAERPIARFTHRETMILFGCDLTSDCAHAWAIEHPTPSRVELAAFLNYESRNTVDGHMSRARKHVQKHFASYHGLLDELLP